MSELKPWRDYWIGRELPITVGQEFHIPASSVQPTFKREVPHYEWAASLLQLSNEVEGYLEIETHLEEPDDEIFLGKPGQTRFAIPLPISAEITQDKRSPFLLPAVISVSLQSIDETIEDVEMEVTIGGRTFRTNFDIIYEEDNYPNYSENKYNTYSSHWTEVGTGEKYDALLIPPTPEVITSAAFIFKNKSENI